jgi:hypothetical protein
MLMRDSMSQGDMCGCGAQEYSNLVVFHNTLTDALAQHLLPLSICLCAGHVVEEDNATPFALCVDSRNDIPIPQVDVGAVLFQHGCTLHLA